MPLPLDFPLAEQNLSELRDVLASVIIVDHPLPVELLPRAWMQHVVQGLDEILAGVMAAIGHVLQTRQRFFPALQDIGQQRRQLLR
jgi:hypothetical protein